MDRQHTLRPYQARAVAQVLSHWAAGRRRVCVCVPTGGGKTTIAAAVLAAAPPGSRALALVHTRTLRKQTAARLGADVRVMTIQGVLRAGVPLTDVDVVFLDECHHLGAASWQRVLALLPAHCLVLGCTATPQRADGAALGRGGAGFDAMVATATYTELLRAGALAPCRVVSAPEHRNNPAAAYLRHGRAPAHTGGGWRPGIIFAPTMVACAATVVALRTAGVRAVAIDATTSDKARAAAFAAYDRGELDVLASPMALAEGFDSPRAAVCVLDRGCDHVGTYLQTAGRVLRPHPTKGAGPGAMGPAVVVDLRGAAARHGSPTDDRAYSLEGTAIAPAARRADLRHARPTRITASEVGREFAHIGRGLASWVAGWFRTAAA